MAKLAAGVRRKENGRYEKRFTVDGKRYSVSGNTSKECVEKELALRKELEEGTYIKNQNLTVDQWYREWCDLRKNKIKESTQINIDSRYSSQIKPYLGNIKLQKIEKRMIHQWIEKLLKEEYKPSTINESIATVKCMLNDAVKEEIIQKNPAQFIDKLSLKEQPKAVDTIHRALTKEEQKLFIEYSKEQFLYEYMYLSLCTGMRLKEISALTWSDIDYDKKVIHITKIYSRGDKLTSPKTETSKRDIPLTNTIEKILKSQKEKMFMAFGGKYVSVDSVIFRGARGSIVESNVVSATIVRVLKKIKKEKNVDIERFTHHAFRDTFATRYIEGGGTLQTLKVILGHSSLEMTADLYSHVLPDTKQKEMEQVENMFHSVVI